MNQFIGRRNQIKFFVRFKADRGLKYLRYDPYVYHVVYQFASLASLLTTGGLKRQRE